MGKRASDGIGLAYCKLLAKQGFNILMISRSDEKLKTVQKEVQAQNQDVIVSYEVQDLGKLSTYKEYVDRFQKVFQSIDVGILINNAGIGFTGSYLQMTYEEAEAVFALNNFHATYLCKMLMSTQTSRNERTGIIAVASLMAYYHFPWHIYYSCTKRFIEYLYQGVNFEAQADIRTKGKFDVQCYLPGFVATKLSRKEVGFTIPDTITAAEGALKDLGRREISYGVIDHHILGWLIKFLVKTIPESIIGFILMKEGEATHKKLRSKGYSFI
ncbi:steroid dehydrogenase [Stylonychia lemnae]|uniref:Steroid dehydrogenase n=1 Tax=Stylonychia lemnae TaxID=5949 RepID=A0A078AW04_STYLE|nr:steroid dehydrogenase [Stylonychia lemnae]|eukprot:CDW86354.1 steroid dehydrogenase [Stylonychia lemnae]